MLQLSIIQDIDASTLDEIAAFRYRTWTAEGATFKDPAIALSKRWTDRVDVTATTAHWLIRDQGRIVAAARLSMHAFLQDVPDSRIFRDTLDNDERPMAALNRLVVEKAYRCRGLGRFLDSQRIAMACALGARLVMVEAVGDKRCLQLTRQGFAIDSAHAHDPDFSFDMPKTYYALVGKAETVGHKESLHQASRALNIEVLPHHLTHESATTRTVNFS